MPPPADAGLPADWLHRLARLYLAVAYHADGVLDPHEREMAAALLHRWAPGLAVDDALAVVDTALVAVRSGLDGDLEALAGAVERDLGAEVELRVLDELGQLARADGHLTVAEADAIARVRAVWHDASRAGGG